MNKLVIITGISGSGKTTLAKYLHQEIEESVLISVDSLQENIYDTIGFRNEKQKKILREIAYNTFQNILEESMRRGERCIITEFPFRIKWKNFFEECIKNYDYEAITINAIVDDFDENWDRIIKRDYSLERHPSHELTCYNPLCKNEYEKVENIDYWELKEESDTKKFHQINLGRVIEFHNESEKSLKEILRKIKE